LFEGYSLLTIDYRRELLNQAKIGIKKDPQSGND